MDREIHFHMLDYFHLNRSSLLLAGEADAVTNLQPFLKCEISRNTISLSDFCYYDFLNVKLE